MSETLTREEFRETLAKAKAAKPGKYRAQPIIVDNIRFASRREAGRWCELRLLERSGEITDLERQIAYRLHVCGKHVATYYCDHRYRDKNGELVVEDVKSTPTRTPQYLLKKKMLKAEYGIEIKET
jgi:Protein of unknown function (DUF1064)